MNKKKISLLLVLTMLVGSLLSGCGVNPAEESDLENGVPEKEVAQTEESPQYRMCMILSMYINSDFSGWDEPENKYPIEWLIDYVRVYKDINGYE